MTQPLLSISSGETGGSHLLATHVPGMRCLGPPGEAIQASSSLEALPDLLTGRVASFPPPTRDPVEPRTAFPPLEWGVTLHAHLPHLNMKPSRTRQCLIPLYTLKVLPCLAHIFISNECSLKELNKVTHSWTMLDPIFFSNGMKKHNLLGLCDRSFSSMTALAACYWILIPGICKESFQRRHPLSPHWTHPSWCQLSSAVAGLEVKEGDRNWHVLRHVTWGGQRDGAFISGIPRCKEGDFGSRDSYCLLEEHKCDGLLWTPFIGRYPPCSGVLFVKSSLASKGNMLKWRKSSSRRDLEEISAITSCPVHTSQSLPSCKSVTHGSLRAPHLCLSPLCLWVNCCFFLEYLAPVIQ